MSTNLSIEVPSHNKYSQHKNYNLSAQELCYLFNGDW